MSEIDHFDGFVDRFPGLVAQLPDFYFQEGEQAFARVLAQGAEREDFYFEVAGIKICLRFAGRKLIPALTSVFAHLACTASGGADMTILCWDNQSTGGKMLPPPSRFMRDMSNNCLNRVVCNDRFTFFYHDWMHVMSGIDRESSRAFYCVQDAERWPLCEQAMPMKHLLNPIFNRRGKQLVHAAAVGDARGSLLITAPGGHGKSSTALAALENGLLYSSDDVCLISDEKNPRSFCLYDTAKLRYEGINRLAGFEPLLTHFEEFGERKACFHVHQHYPEKILREAPIRAVLYPEITGEPASRVVPANRLEVMRDSLPSTLKLLPHTEKPGQHILFNLYSRVPAYRLLLGKDPVQLTQVLQELLASPST